jgi:hypothetical protein
MSTSCGGRCLLASVSRFTTAAQARCTSRNSSLSRPPFLSGWSRLARLRYPRRSSSKEAPLRHPSTCSGLIGLDSIAGRVVEQPRRFSVRQSLFRISSLFLFRDCCSGLGCSIMQGIPKPKLHQNDVANQSRKEEALNAITAEDRSPNW